MKVEIELEDLEKIKRERGMLSKLTYDQKKIIDRYDKDKMYKDSEKVAIELFKKYMKATFRELGFDDYIDEVTFHNLKHWIGEEWYHEKPNRRNKLKIELGASVTKEFKRAFIEMGFCEIKK